MAGVKLPKNGNVFDYTARQISFWWKLKFLFRHKRWPRHRELRRLAKTVMWAKLYGANPRKFIQKELDKR